MSRYVLTGSPCSGKTSVIEEIARRGISIVPENLTSVVREQRALGVAPERDPYLFRKALIERQLTAERDAPPDAVLDVGLPENAAYWQLHHGALPEEFRICLTQKRYDGVFFLEPLPYYEHNGIRFETHAQALDAGRRIILLYRQLGYPVIRVPVLPVRERADLVLRNTVFKIL